MAVNTVEVIIPRALITRLQYASRPWRRLRSRVITSLRQSASYARANMMWVGIVAILGQPIYYYVWTEIYPQPFESSWLRLLGVIFALPMLFEPYLPQNDFWNRKLTVYWFTVLIYELPFLFVFMTLMNNFSTVWDLSTMAACMLLAMLVFDWLTSLLLFFIGGGLAWICFMLVGGALADAGPPLGALIPTYLFALIAGGIFNRKKELVAREKLTAITAVMSTIAHELRTPLLGIHSGVLGLQDYMPAIFEGYEMARASGLPVKPIRRAHYRQLGTVLSRIRGEIDYTQVIVDMLLINSRQTPIDTSSFAPVSIIACVETALERFPFHSQKERERISWAHGNDFVFLGSKLLMVHVLFNLIKNALYFVASVEDGRIQIWIEAGSTGSCRLHFRDTGLGIHPEVLPRIFERFYTAMPQGQGTGIGLAFAQLVMVSFGGDIRCHSALGHYTEFVMTFPVVEDDGINRN